MGMNGFFSTSEMQSSIRPVSTLVADCGKCGLFKTCKNPFMPWSGKGKRKILLLGESPGKTEDERNIQFIGESGQLLESTLAKFGVDMREDCWITNSTICRPPSNILPPKAIDYCRPNLLKTLEELKPEIIIPLGASAVKSLLGWLWKEDVGQISRWDGWQIPSQRLNAWICSTWHPAFILRSDYGTGKENDLRRLFFEKHLQAAVELKGRPWKKIPDFKKQVKCIYNDDDAAAIVRAITQANLPTAFDYETDRLKPEPTDSRIVCCSISNGNTTIAFPWMGRAIEAMKEFLVSDVPKVASNLKFEARWTQKQLGIKVNNWYWDTMLAAHVMDNRPSISSIKFQAFVLLGVDSWDDKIKPFLKAFSANAKNRVTEAPLADLLVYCALDSLFEIKVAKIQKRQMEEMCNGEAVRQN